MSLKLAGASSQIADCRNHESWPTAIRHGESAACAKGAEAFAPVAERECHLLHREALRARTVKRSGWRLRVRASSEIIRNNHPAHLDASNGLRQQVRRSHTRAGRQIESDIEAMKQAAATE